MKEHLIGRIIATEKKPTTMETFTFWTDANLKLHAFDMVKVKHIEGSYSYGVIQNISHLTDAQSFLASYISSDFGDLNQQGNTDRLGMNCVEAVVAYNDKNIYTPVHSEAEVYLASAGEITLALGLDAVGGSDREGQKDLLTCGMIRMYEGTENEISLQVPLNAKFLLGPEGAHLNISGISGLAAKTSYAMFLMKAAQEHFMQKEAYDATGETVAYVIFNVKGRDLMAIHEENAFPPAKKAKVLQEYQSIGLSGKPFEHVSYFIPYARPNQARRTYLKQEEEETYQREGILQQFKYTYEDDKGSIEMLFSDVDDPQETMAAILNKVMDDSDADFGGLGDWDSLLSKVSEFSEAKSARRPNEISALSWRKFKRIINKAIKNDSMFATRVDVNKEQCRLAYELMHIHKNDVYVIDIAKLSEDKQAFVFGDAIRAIYNLKLGAYDDELGREEDEIPSRIVVFVDELNKYASKDAPKSSAILRELLDVTERGRSLGVVLFGAEQFRSHIHPRITGNASTHAYGRTNIIETETKDYRSLPSVYKGILTRLQQGEYVIQNPMFRSLLRIYFPEPAYKQFDH